MACSGNFFCYIFNSYIFGRRYKITNIYGGIHNNSYITALIFRAVCNLMCNGITLRNINTRNINTNTLNANQVIDNGDNSIDENNNNNGCSCSCGNCYRGNCSYNLNRNYNGYNYRCRR